MCVCVSSPLQPAQLITPEVLFARVRMCTHKLFTCEGMHVQPLFGVYDARRDLKKEKKKKGDWETNEGV